MSKHMKSASQRGRRAPRPVRLSSWERLSNFVPTDEPMPRRLTRIGLRIWHNERVSPGDRFLAMVVLAQRAQELHTERYGRADAQSTLYLADQAQELIQMITRRAGRPVRGLRTHAILEVIEQVTGGTDDPRFFNRIAKALERLRAEAKRQKAAQIVAKKTTKKRP
jgi:hypothetical protein